MAQTGRTFRVFVSSTFSDLIAERNALQERVFPRLRELCQRHGCRFQAIDLRWGVSEEAGMDQQTMNICLQELKRCQRLTPRPNFIVLLGDRYGWQPLPPQVEVAEFEQILAQVSPDERELLVFSENQPDASRGWYRRDDNAVPAQYCLRPIRPPEAAGWTALEKTLRAILLRAIERLGWPADDPRRVKYEASATHQEILHGAEEVKDTLDHAFCFFRSIRGLPRDASARDFIDLDENAQPDPDAQARLLRLKDQLRSNFPANISDYEAVWSGNGPGSDHLAGLCDTVYERLSSVILDEVKRLEQTDPVDQEAIAHADFGRERARHFIGRADLLRRIQEYVESSDQSRVTNHQSPLVVHGVSGSGKSALMAKAAERQEASGKREDEVVVRYIGATPASSDIRSLLEGLCREISLRYGAEEAVPAEYRKLVEEFPKRLALATAAKPLVVFLDALDQLSDADQGRNLAWLPTQLPAHVRLVLSTLPGECLTTLQQRIVGQASSLPINESQAGMLAPLFLEVTPMSATEGEALLDAWLQEAGRTLQPEQRREVLAKFGGCPLPLYLKLAFDEARRWKSWEQPRRTDTPVCPTSPSALSPDIPSILNDMFARLKQPQHHGQMLVSHAMGYLAAGRHGLTEDELLDVLSADPNVMADFQRRSPNSPKVDRLPVVVWARLYADLESYMTVRSADGTTVLAFYHRQVGEVAHDKYLSGDNKLRSHRALANCFQKQPNFRESLRDPHAHASHLPTMSRLANLRKVDELPWQRMEAQQWDELRGLLTDVSFLEAKVEAGMVHSLIEDYHSAFEASRNTKASEWSSDRPSLGVSFFLRALRKNAQLIFDVPTSIRTQLILTGLNEAIDPELLVREFAKDSLLVPSRVPAEIPNPHSEEVVSVTASGDSQRVATCDLHGQVVVWDVKKRRWLTRYAAVKGRAEVVCFLDLGGELLATACEDGSIHIAESSTGAPRARLCKHESQLLALASNGTFFASGGVDERVFLWDAKALTFLAEVGVPKDRGMIQSLAFDDGHHLLVGTHTGRVECWDLRCPTAPKLCYQFDLPTPSNPLAPFSIEQIVFVPQSRFACVSDCEPKIAIFDALSGELCNQVRHPGSYAPRLAPSPDGKTLVCSHDKGLMAFAIPSGQHLWKIDADIGSIGSLALLEDGRCAFTGHSDSSVAIWDIADRKRIWAQPGVRNTAISAAAIDSGRAICVSGGAGGQISVVDLETAKTLHHVKTDIGQVGALGVCAVGNVFAALGWSRRTIVASTTTGRETMRFPAGEFGRMVCLSPQGDRLAIGCEQDLTVFDLTNQTSVFRTKDASSAWIVSGVFSDHPDFLYLGDSWGICHEIQLSTGGVRHLNPSSRQIRGWCQFLAELEARKWLVSAAGSQLFVWDLMSGCVQRELVGHRSDVCAGAVSKDGKWLVTGDEHGRIILWEMASWRIAGGALLQAPIRALAFDQLRSCLWVVDAASGIYQFALR